MIHAIVIFALYFLLPPIEPELGPDAVISMQKGGDVGEIRLAAFDGQRELMWAWWPDA